MLKVILPALGATLFAATAASAQMPQWDAAQTEVWGFVKQSWVDDAGETGKWPKDYIHEQAAAWGTSSPFPRAGESWLKWSRHADETGDVVLYDLMPMTISVVNGTAVIHYAVDMIEESDADERERVRLGLTEVLVKEGGAWKHLSTTDFPLGSDDD